MDKTFVEDVVALNKVRAQYARFLASLFLYEVTDEQIENMAHLEYANDGSCTAKGYQTIVDYLRHRNRSTRQDLAVDYAHTFLCAGTYDHVLAPPYESVFTSKQRLLMQGARDGALAYYRSEELELPADNTTPEDHLGFELQFVATMIDRSSEALEAGNDERFIELIKKQRGFLSYHQENWLPLFCNAIDQYCQTNFYHGVADLTRGYLEMERSVLDDIAAEFQIEDDEEIRSPWMDLNEEDSAKMEAMFEVVPERG